MLYPYILINALLFYISWVRYKTVVNPVSIYSITWSFSVVLHELRLVYYYDVGILTWLTLIMFELIFCISCLASTYKTTSNNLHETRAYDNSKIEKQLRFWILVFSAVASIAILTGVINMLKTYGGNILSAIQMANKTYNDRLSGENRFFTIPYLSAFVYAALVYVGIYCSLYKFKVFMLIPIGLVCALAIGSGNRYGLIIAVLFILIPLIYGKNNKQRQKTRQPKKLWSKVVLVVGIVAIGYVFLQLTEVRSTWITVNQNVSPLMSNLMSISPGFYKLYTYAASPIGVMNAFLKDSYSVPFGSYTFAFIYNLFDKIGITVDGYDKIGRSYLIPILANTGTYIKSFIAEYGAFSIFATAIWGRLCGKAYMHIRANNGIALKSVSYILFAVLFLSFFTWYMCETLFWISIFLTYYVGRFIERKSVI